jgi:putative flavoprotein involved in K+ transport
MIASKTVHRDGPLQDAPERHDTIVIGGGQAGLATGYYLKQQGRDFIILDASERIGDAWRKRWDSLHLFTPTPFSELAGMPFPAPRHSLPSKDEMADYLEAYAARFALPVRTGIKVDRLTRQGSRFMVAAGPRRFEADNVVVAMGSYQQPKVPPFADELDPSIVQMHSTAYRNPGQLREGGVLVVGAGNSGAEIAMEVVGSHPTWLAGRDTGHVPFRVTGVAARLIIPVLFRVIFHRVLTMSTPMGRKVRAKRTSQGMALIRVKPADLAAAGVERVPRVTGVREGRPVLEDGRVLEAANVIWCTGYQPAVAWIDLPIFENGEPRHTRGVVTEQPGLFFVGLRFLYAASSEQIQGVGRDAEFVTREIQKAISSRQQARGR